MNIKNRLEKHIKKNQEAYDKSHVQIDSKFYPSSLGLCPRFLFMEKTNPRKDSEDLKSIGIVGTMFHDWIEDELYKDYKCEQVVKFDNGKIQISGRVDAVNDEEVIDFKTCSNIDYIDEPKDEHIAQLTVYMHILKLKKGKLIYITKSTFKCKEFTIKYDKKKFDEIIAKLETIHNHILKKSKPTDVVIKDTIPHYTMCKYCKYRDICYNR